MLRGEGMLVAEWPMQQQPAMQIAWLRCSIPNQANAHCCCCQGAVLVA